MNWEDLLFMHWPVDAGFLRRLIPAGLELDLYQGQAWIALVPFRMAGVRPRFLPGLPGLSAFPELNVRTYVTRGGIPGVWFFSLDAANPVAVRAARRFFHLPYFDADMKVELKQDTYHYSSHRTHHGAAPASLEMTYTPTGPAYRAADGTLDDWLTARYCLYAADDEGGIFRTSIHHKPWRLQPAEALVRVNTMTEAFGLKLPDTAPLLHFALKTEVAAWLPERLP
ncbi:MAG: hypothetical protein JWP91_1226 [Fibrobacteres bacterium]|nr:hypothetical protein [Fibrobacterota bacterium]